MAVYSLSKLLTRVAELEMGVFSSPTTTPKIDVNNVSIGILHIYAEVSIKLGKKRLDLGECAYPKELFTECEKDSGVDVALANAARTLDKLYKAEYNEEDDTLRKVKEFIGRICTYKLWTQQAIKGDTEMCEPEYYAERLQAYVDDASSFLTTIMYN